MKKFIVGFTKVIPWVYMIVGIVMIFANPPRRSGAYGDEDGAAAMIMLIGVIASSLLFFAFAYVVEAACHYLEKNKGDKNK